MTAVMGAALSIGAAHAEVVVRVAPPAPIVETRPVAPGPNYVWVGGYHTWNGNAYVWTPGTWVAPPRARARWVAPRWVHRHHGYVFVAGHWR